MAVSFGDPLAVMVAWVFISAHRLATTTTCKHCTLLLAAAVTDSGRSRAVTRQPSAGDLVRRQRMRVIANIVQVAYACSTGSIHRNREARRPGNGVDGVVTMKGIVFPTEELHRN